MKLVLLAAGKGERLRPITETRPKPLVRVVKESMLCRNLRMAMSLRSFDEILVVIQNELKDRLFEIDCLRGLDEKTRLIIQKNPKGTAHAVLTAINESGFDDLFVVYSDVFIPMSLWNKLDKLRPSSILAAPTDKPWEYGVLKVKPPLVYDIFEKPKPNEVSSNLVFIGIASIAREHVRYIKEVKESSRGELELTDALLKIAKNEELAFVNLGSYEWRDIGRPWDLLLANRYVLDNEIEKWEKKGDVHPTAFINEDVYIEPGAKIGPYSVINGPSYIARGATIGPHSHIRPYSVILENAKVGYSAEIKASILMEKARAPHFNYVGDSIVCEDVNLGAGTITANLRFDKKTIKMTLKGKRVDSGLRKLGAVIGGHAQTGINVSLMPGVRIGSYARIWPGCVVYEDVPQGADYRC